MLKRETVDRTAWLIMDRPEKLNAMPRSFMAELTDAMSDVAADDDVRCVVFAGEGRSFSVGGDIEDFGNIGGVSDRRAYMAEALGAYKAVDELPKPTIAAVHGNAMGGGCELTMVCDIVVADETARFATPEVGVGLIPGPGIVRGVSHVNLHWMKWLVLTGLPIDAEQARLAGLVNVVVPAGEHRAEAQRLADVIASRSALAQAVGKAYLSRGTWDGQHQAAEVLALLQGADDFAEGIAAFVEGRAPSFGAR
jgi:enoyl-CoA hydratase/carnithine racemase